MEQSRTEKKYDGPLISVIIPVYNTERYLRQCVDSVLGQTYGNIEVLLVNDGSTDRGGLLCDVCAASDSRVRVIHKRNGGLSDARNAGIDAACGGRLIFLDSDDYWAAENFLETVAGSIDGDNLIIWRYQRCRENETVGMPEDHRQNAPFGNRQYVPFRNRQYTPFRNRQNAPFRIRQHTPFRIRQNAPFRIRQYALSSCYRELFGSGALFAGACYLAVSGGRFRDGRLRFITGALSEDVEWFAELLASVEKITLIDAPVYVYRIRHGSISGTCGEPTVRHAFAHILSLISAYSQAGSAEYIEAMNTYLAEQIANFIIVLSRCPSPEQYMDDAEKFIPYLRYAARTRSKVIRLAAEVCGLKNTARLLQLPDRLRRRMTRAENDPGGELPDNADAMSRRDGQLRRDERTSRAGAMGN